MSNGIWRQDNSQCGAEYATEEDAVIGYSFCSTTEVSVIYVMYGIVKCEGLDGKETELGKDASIPSEGHAGGGASVPAHFLHGRK